MSITKKYGYSMTDYYTRIHVYLFKGNIYNLCGTIYFDYMLIVASTTTHTKKSKKDATKHGSFLLLTTKVSLTINILIESFTPYKYRVF